MTEYKIPSAEEAYYTAKNKQRLIVRDYILQSIQKGITHTVIPKDILGDKGFEGPVIGELLDKGYKIGRFSGDYLISWNKQKK